MLKEAIKETEQQLSQRQCQWRNLLFDKNGKSYRGITLHDSREKCEAHFRKWEASVLSHKAVTDKRWYSDTLDGVLYSKDYAWGMQIPILS